MSLLARHRAAARAGDEAGFAVVEVMIAMSIFAILALGFAGALASSLRAQVATRLRTTADQLATEQVERARALSYDQVGVVGGNPPGTLSPTADVAAGGTRLRVATTVSLADDPIPGGFSTYANYKRLQVTVTRIDDGRTLARVETLVAPPTQPSLRNAVVQARIVDHGLNAPLPGVLVRLQNGPGGSRSQLTPGDGGAVFPALTPNPLTGPLAHYDLTASLDGYVTLREDLPPAGAAHAQLAAGQVFNTVLRLYLPATIEVDVLDDTGAPLAGAATVVVSSVRGTEAFPVTDGHLTVTSVAGEPVVPALEYTVGAVVPGAISPASRAIVPPDYPRDLVSHFTLQPVPTTTQRLQVLVRDDANQPQAGATVVVTGGPADTITTGVTNAGGVAQIEVPAGTSAPYTVTAAPVAGHDPASISVVLQSNPNSTTVATLVLPRSS